MTNYVYILTETEIGDWDISTQTIGVFSSSDFVLDYLENQCFVTEPLEYTQLSPTLEHERRMISVEGYHQKTQELFEDEDGDYYTLGWFDKTDEVFHDYYSHPKVWFEVHVVKVDKLCVNS